MLSIPRRNIPTGSRAALDLHPDVLSLVITSETSLLGLDFSALQAVREVIFPVHICGLRMVEGSGRVHNFTRSVGVTP